MLFLIFLGVVLRYGIVMVMVLVEIFGKIFMMFVGIVIRLSMVMMIMSRLVVMLLLVN